MVKKISVLLGIVFFATVAQANVNDAVNAQKKEEQQQLSTQQATVDHFSQLSAQDMQKSIALVNHFLYHGQQSLAAAVPRPGGKAANGALLFVSFSMPKSLLVQMALQASHYHIPVILRGLVGNSMPKTLQAILDVKVWAKHHHQAFSGMGIDPVWFSQFGITAVPALVVTHRPAHCMSEKQCPGQPFDVVYGNQSVHDSLVQIARSGSAVIKPIAAQLVTGKVAHHA